MAACVSCLTSLCVCILISQQLTCLVQCQGKEQESKLNQVVIRILIPAASSKKTHLYWSDWENPLLLKVKVRIHVSLISLPIMSVIQVTCKATLKLSLKEGSFGGNYASLTGVRCRVLAYHSLWLFVYPKLVVFHNT